MASQVEPTRSVSCSQTATRRRARSMGGTSSSTASDACSMRSGPEPTRGRILYLASGGDSSARGATRDRVRRAVAGPRLTARQLYEDVGPGRADRLRNARRQRWIGRDDHDDQAERRSQDRDEEAVKIT